MTDIADLITAAIGCQQCELPLSEESDSADFCGPVCQARWHQQHADRPVWADPPETHGPNPLGVTVRPGRDLPIPPVVHPGGEAGANGFVEFGDSGELDDRAMATMWNRLYDSLTDLATRNDLTLIRVTRYDQQIEPSGVRLSMSAMIGPPCPEFRDGGIGDDLAEYIEFVRAESAWSEQFAPDGPRQTTYPPRRWMPGMDR